MNDDTINRDRKNIGNKIKEMRQAKGWDQSELSRRTEIPLMFIQQFEHGAFVPGQISQNAISKALEFDLSLYIQELTSSVA